MRIRRYTNMWICSWQLCARNISVKGTCSWGGSSRHQFLGSSDCSRSTYSYVYIYIHLYDISVYVYIHVYIYIYEYIYISYYASVVYIRTISVESNIGLNRIAAMNIGHLRISCQGHI